MILKCYVSDRCNFRCPDCHWFSEDVKVIEASADTLLPTILSPEWTEIDFTGGEPTLWEPLADTVNAIPGDRTVGVFTNGSRPKALSAIARPIWILLSIHPETDWDVVRELLSLAAGKKWRVSAVSFPADTPVPEWFRLGARGLSNQIADGERYRHLLSRRVVCAPRTGLLGTDGHLYSCERGLRSKDPAFRHACGKLCRVEENCLSAFSTEQFLGKDDGCEPGDT
jgi:hypothetical protein